MSKRTRLLVGVSLFVGLLLGSAALLQKGFYGWTVFIVFPLFAGGLASWIFRPASSDRALSTGVLTGVMVCCGFLLLGIEGIICVLMSLPLILPLSAVGSWLVYLAFDFDDSRTAALIMLLPASLWFDANAKPPLYTVRTSVIVNASPEHVWKYAVAFPDISDPKDWLSRTGLAYPKRTRIVGSGIGAARYCDLSTGSVVERVVVWDEPHMLQFKVISTAPSMEERGLYGPIHPKHLTGYFISKRGQFQLSALPHGRTLLEGISWYQHGLWPAEYWRWWSDAIVHRIHTRVLNHIRMLSERESAAQ